MVMVIKKEEMSFDINKEKKKALKISIWEGSGCSVMNGAGGSFITPFALAIKSSNFQIGFLSSFVGLIGPLAQWGSSHLMEKYDRKKIVVYTVLIQSLLWLPIMFLGLMFFFNIWKTLLPIFLIIFYSLHIGIGAIAGPPWFSWMGDLVPNKERGRYFGKRNEITQTVLIVSMLVFGFVLDLFKTKGLILTGFTLLFSVSMFSRLYSSYLFTKQYNPKFKLKRGYYFSFFDFIKHSLGTNFGRFTLFMGLLHLAVYIASPFFAVYMLDELKLSYTWFTILTISQTVFSIVFMPFWGKFTDRYGNRLAILICCLMIPLVPILWMFSANKLYLLIVPQLIGGICWGGFGLATVNFIYDSAKPEHRALCSTYYNVLVGIGVFIGGIFGGVIAKYTPLDFVAKILPGRFASIFLFLFLVSAVTRLIVVLIFLPQITEVRSVKKPHILVREHKFVVGLEHGLKNINHSFIHGSTLFFNSSQIKKTYKIFR
ncbi:MAG: MFS transporter [Candidatus Pacearchaeota archaeon]